MSPLNFSSPGCVVLPSGSDGNLDLGYGYIKELFSHPSELEGLTALEISAFFAKITSSGDPKTLKRAWKVTQWIQSNDILKERFGQTVLSKDTKTITINPFLWALRIAPWRDMLIGNRPPVLTVPLLEKQLKAVDLFLNKSDLPTLTFDEYIGLSQVAQGLQIQELDEICVKKMIQLLDAAFDSTDDPLIQAYLVFLRQIQLSLDVVVEFVWNEISHTLYLAVDKLDEKPSEWVSYLISKAHQLTFSSPEALRYAVAPSEASYVQLNFAAAFKPDSLGDGGAVNMEQAIPNFTSHFPMAKELAWGTPSCVYTFSKDASQETWTYQRSGNPAEQLLQQVLSVGTEVEERLREEDRWLEEMQGHLNSFERRQKKISQLTARQKLERDRLDQLLKVAGTFREARLIAELRLVLLHQQLPREEFPPPMAPAIPLRARASESASASAPGPTLRTDAPMNYPLPAKRPRQGDIQS
ncbi:MAG: hypothetical protein K940chlam2_01705 [Chlamydiae bacterium]|nr:hypothetical protein [Chlamydiota bacterium]